MWLSRVHKLEIMLDAASHHTPYFRPNLLSSVDTRSLARQLASLSSDLFTSCPVLRKLTIDIICNCRLTFPLPCRITALQYEELLGAIKIFRGLHSVELRNSNCRLLQQLRPAFERSTKTPISTQRNKEDSEKKKAWRMLRQKVAFLSDVHDRGFRDDLRLAWSFIDAGNDTQDKWFWLLLRRAKHRLRQQGLLSEDDLFGENQLAIRG
ncbi:MAG: hypothetical protein Q9219_006772 [cf. Caloplaca sp. 3 TL-2023]